MKYQKAQYKDQPIKALRGNPLIEALPVVKKDLIDNFDLFYHVHAPTKSERNIPSGYKGYELSNIEDFYHPMSWHLQVAAYIDKMIREGYRYRNPMEIKQRNKTIFMIENNRSDLLPVRKPSPTFALIGISGIGKTSAVSRKLFEYDRVICHENYHGQDYCELQIPYLWADAPHDGSIKGFCMAILEEIDKVTGKDFTKKYSRSSAAVLQTVISKLCVTYNVGLIVVDEIQNLLNSKQGYQNLTDFLNNLSNKIKIPLFFIGTPKALELFEKTLYLCRRMGNQGVITLEAYRPDDPEWKLFINELWENNQYTRTENPLTPEIEKTLTELSFGLPALAVELYSQAQMLAFLDPRNTKEIIDEKQLLETSKKLSKPITDFTGNLSKNQLIPSEAESLPDKTIVKKINRKIQEKKSQNIKNALKSEVRQEILQSLKTFDYHLVLSEEDLEQIADIAVKTWEDEGNKQDCLLKAVSMAKDYTEKKLSDPERIELETIGVLGKVADETEIF